ncbi:MAG: SGNH/GDSL hydrolase family protein [Vicinamibacterales bacterium]
MRRLLVLAAVTLLTAGCGSTVTAPSPVATPPPPVVAPAPAPTPTPTPPIPALPAGPTLSVSRILCFGDSLTAGFISQTTAVLMAVADEAYPTRLQLLLNARYPSQTIVVDSAGVFGEWADDGKERIVATVRLSRPDVVVLMEGANDINGAGEAGVAFALDGLENMLRDARALGATVFLASIPPHRPGSRLGGEPELVRELNDGIQSLAARQRVTFVDVNRAFGGDLSLIGPDGLHPTAAGYQRIADTMFQALRSAFERQ